MYAAAHGRLCSYENKCHCSESFLQSAIVGFCGGEVRRSACGRKKGGSQVDMAKLARASPGRRFDGRKNSVIAR